MQLEQMVKHPSRFMKGFILNHSRNKLIDHQPPFFLMYSAKPGFPRLFRQKQSTSSHTGSHRTRNPTQPSRLFHLSPLFFRQGNGDATRDRQVTRKGGTKPPLLRPLLCDFLWRRGVCVTAGSCAGFVRQDPFQPSQNRVCLWRPVRIDVLRDCKRPHYRKKHAEE